MKKIRAVATMPTREMNHTETRYSQYLEDQKRAGLILWWDFECIKIRLADRTWYTPDFLVVANGLTLEAHEVKTYWKGRHGQPGRSGWQEDARVKIKVVAEHFPIRFLGVTAMPDLGWQVEEFNGSEEKEACTQP
jgi:hypothetical protein